MAKIAFIGGCIVDLMSYASRFPKPGETLAGAQFCKGFGGKGANQCVMAKKLGASVAMIAKLGDDSFGKEYIQNLKENLINIDHVTVSTLSHTSTAAITVTDGGQNNIIYVPGAVMELSSQDISDAAPMINNSKVLVCTYECPLDTLLTALKLAKTHNVLTVVNAAPTTNPSYEQIYQYTDIICMNEVEAEDATGISIQSMEDAEEVIKILHSKCCSTVILTLGSKGAVFQSKDQQTFAHVPANAMVAVDSTGAGDAFMGSLAYFLAERPHLNLVTMIQHACEIATLSVLKKGTQTSFPSREDLPDEMFQ